MSNTFLEIGPHANMVAVNISEAHLMMGAVLSYDDDLLTKVLFRL